MNICLLINSFNLGGAEKLIYDIAFQLKKNHKNVIVVAMKKAETPLEKNLSSQLSERGIPIDTINKPVGKGRIAAVLRIKKLIKKYEIDILHTNGQSPDFYGRIAAVFCRGVKTVVTIHNTKGYSKKVEKLLNFATNAYTAVSEETAYYCRNSLGIRDITTIDNGIDFDRYLTDSQTDDNIILSVGRVVPQKGYIKVVTEMNTFLSKYPDFYWYIVGDTTQNPDYFKQLNSLIDDCVKDRIIFTGAVISPEDYYKKASIFLLPSEYEGFGIAYIEAIAAKLPIVCNKVGVITDILKAGGTVSCIQKGRLEDNLRSAQNFSESQLDYNYEYCKNHYSIQAKTKEYYNIYCSVLGEKNEYTIT